MDDFLPAWQDAFGRRLWTLKAAHASTWNATGVFTCPQWTGQPFVDISQLWTMAVTKIF